MQHYSSIQRRNKGYHRRQRSCWLKICTNLLACLSFSLAERNEAQPAQATNLQISIFINHYCTQSGTVPKLPPGTNGEKCFMVASEQQNRSESIFFLQENFPSWDHSTYTHPKSWISGSCLCLVLCDELYRGIIWKASQCINDSMYIISKLLTELMSFYHVT